MNRQLLIVVCLVFFNIGSLSVSALSWQIEYGQKSGQVSVFNSNTDKNFSEDLPFGPMSYRVVSDNLWLLDSIGGRLLRFTKDGKIDSVIDIPGLNENRVLEDFVLVKGSSGKPESVWIADASDCIIRKISLANSSELLRIGGQGNEKGKFLQIAQLEVDRGGRLYVADYGRNLISVFTQYGELVREVPWEHCGFAVDTKGGLHLLSYKDSAGYFHRVYSREGILASSRHIGLADLKNPRIWETTSGGGLIVSFIPAGGFKGSLKLFEFSPFARIIRQTEFVPPVSMNRFVYVTSDKTWLAKADYFTAPAGKFIVEDLNWEGKR